MLRNSFLMMGLLVLTSVGSAMAGVIQLAGTMTLDAGSPSSPFGAGPVSYTASFNLVRSTSTIANFTGSMVIGATPVTFSGAGNFANISATQLQLIGGNNTAFGTVVMTFPGISGSWANQAALDSMIASMSLSGASGTLSFTDNNTTAQWGYEGTVKAVPEPTSAIALLGLGVGFGIRYRRNLRKSVAK